MKLLLVFLAAALAGLVALYAFRPRVLFDALKAALAPACIALP